MKEFEYYQISRYDYNNGLITFNYRSDSQDVYMYKNKSKFDLSKLDYCFGVPGCDNNLAYQAFVSGKYIISNPYEKIKTYHNHVTNIRNYNEEKDRVYKQYAFINMDNTITIVNDYNR